jgi:DNA end-binding protein Ku
MSTTVVKPAVQRSIWSGTITFGLVSCAVKLFTAISEQDVHFNQVCREHKSRIRMPRVCVEGNHECAPADLIKGFDLGDGNLALLEPEVLTTLPLASSKEVVIDSFAPAAQVLSPTRVKKAYYLAPEAVSARSYALLRETLLGSGRVGVGKVALRGGREQLCAVVADGDHLELVTLYWPDEVRDPSGLKNTDSAVKPEELEMAKMLVSSMAADYDASKYTDAYRVALLALLESNTPAPTAVADPAPAIAADALMAALKASVEASKVVALKKKAS